MGVNGFADHDDLDDGIENGAGDDSMAVSRHERHGFAEEYQSEAYMRELESKLLPDSTDTWIVLISVFSRCLVLVLDRCLSCPSLLWDTPFNGRYENSHDTTRQTAARL
jgi:hypothetical protein